MTNAERTITFREREFRGSRLRCLLMTNDSPKVVANLLNSLVSPFAEVSSTDLWAPRGLQQPSEAKLGETSGFLSDQERDSLTSWWLKQKGRANTPNWDLVSTCRVSNRKGLVLVEAKAHEAEFAAGGSGASSPNREQIEASLAEATVAWNSMTPGFSLSAESHYQLSNRFAFAWKLASMGTPVVLVYLGFLDAQDMNDGTCVLLGSHEQWRRCVITKSKGTVPEAAWGQTFDVGGTPLTIVIRSAVVGVHAAVAS
jgi:hypothetical protein